MRLSVGTLRRVAKRDLPIAFVPQRLTSYGGLELRRRYVRRIELPRRLQAACTALGGDYGGTTSRTIAARERFSQCRCSDGRIDWPAYGAVSRAARTSRDPARSSS